MEWLDQLAAIAAVLGLLAAAMWWLRRRGMVRPGLPARRTARNLECMERLALGPQQALYLIRMGERVLVVAASASGCVLLDSADRRSLRSFEGAGE